MKAHDHRPGPSTTERSQLAQGVRHVKMDQVGFDAARLPHESRRQRRRQHSPEFSVAVDDYPTRKDVPAGAPDAGDVHLDLSPSACDFISDVSEILGDACGHRRVEVLQEMGDFNSPAPGGKRAPWR